MREQFHIDKLLSEYNKYKAGDYSSADCIPPRALFAALVIIKDTEIVRSRHRDLSGWSLQSTALRKLNITTSRWNISIESRTEALLKVISITIPKGTTKKSLSMFSPIAISAIFQDNGIVSSKRAKEKIPSLTTLNMFTLVTFEQAVKPNSLTAPQLRELLPTLNEVLKADDTLRNRTCASVYKAIKKNKATIRILWDLFAARVDTDNLLVTENCVVGDVPVDTIVGTTLRYTETEKYVLSIHIPDTIRNEAPTVLLSAMYCLPNTASLYKAIVADIVSRDVEFKALPKTKEILADLGV